MKREWRTLGYEIALATCGAWFVCVAPLMGCARSNIEGAGSQSNWLACSHSDSCPEAQQCHCGFCTKPCELHDECADLHARASCADVSELDAVCEGETTSAPRVCVLECRGPSDCGDDASELSCVEGFCVPASRVGSPDASVTTDGAITGPVALDVEVLITADNAYGFGYGGDTGLRNYFGGINNVLAEDIFNCPTGPETYEVPAAEAQPGDTLYVIAWADSATTQGVLGQFKRGESVVYTGTGNWTVCATGARYDSSTSGPELDEINRQIVLCNEGATDPATTSAGWVDATGNGVGALAIGEPNDTGRGPSPENGNEFPVTCGIGEQARWMWFNWDPQTITWPAQTPFVFPSDGLSVNPDKQFLIFRLAAEETVGPE